MRWDTEEAADDLWERLVHAGVEEDGPPSFGALWPPIVAWSERSFIALAEGQFDEVNLLLAWHHPAGQGGWTYFSPPEQLGEPLFVISVSRSLSRRTGPHATEGLGGTGIDLYFADTPAWEAFATVPGFLGRTAALPAFDYFVDAARMGDLTSDDVLQLAFAQPLVGLRAEGHERIWQ